MSSTDYDSYPRRHQSHQRHHTVTAGPVPAYINRSVPTYSITSHEQPSHTSTPASPRYSPSVQPWKKQHPQSPLSFIPSTSPRSEQSEYTVSQPRRLADRGLACISPFRSVRRMKEPFQLRLPTSPSFDNGSTAFRESEVVTQPQEMRTLRAWRSDQNLMAASLETFGLLPSPPLSDIQTSQASPASTYFSSKPGSEIDNDREAEKDCSCIPERMACNHCSPQTPATDVSVQGRLVESTDVHTAHSTFVRQCDLGNGQFSPATRGLGCMSPPTTCSDVDSVGKRNFSGSSVETQRSRSGTVSSESSWVPSSLSYCETWLQGAPTESAGDEVVGSMTSNRRKFQIVQKSPLVPDWKRAHNDAVLAVKSKMKPKLVDISRQSSPAMSYSLPTPTHIIPATPDQSLPEVSAFSPDTPLEDSGYATHNPTSSPKVQGNNKGNFSETSRGAANSSKTDICDETSEVPKSDPDPEVGPSPNILASPSSRAKKSDKGELEKWWDHEWTIDQLEQSVKDFPQHMLRLTSPVVMFLRHNHERALIRPFRQIFPNASEPLLDSLCAVLIAKHYLLTLPSLNRKTVDTPPRAQFPKLDTVPEKASSILGMKFTQAPPSRIRDQVLGPRCSKLHEELDRTIDNLLFTLRGPPDDALISAMLVLIQVLETKA
ncbi:hypothetical protein BJY04DRAFT_215159 [Aspergillus karnatakaensis]|uniref:uncharacterized protein n=1 Tax=Aspergillus karnatakaensis TaxID=1810916 RepID=UPI003CCCEDFF